MTVTIATTTSTTGTTRSRGIAVTSTGQLWSVHHDNANSRYEFQYSNDLGATWAENTSLRLRATTSNGFSMHIDKTVDRMTFCCGGNGLVFGSGERYGAVVCNNISSTAAWITTLNSSAVDADTGLTVGYLSHPVSTSSIMAADIVSFVKPSSSNFYVARLQAINVANTLYCYIQECTSTGTIVGSRLDFNGIGDLGNTPVWGMIDFRHTGDGSTVASSTPDIYLAGATSGNGYIQFRRLPWNGSGWDTGTLRYLEPSGSNTNYQVSGLFDGTRFIVARVDSGDYSQVDVYERDAGDTETTPRTPTDNDETIQALSISYDGMSDTAIFAGGQTSDDVEEVVYDRSANTWGSWSALHSGSTDIKAYGLSALRGYYGVYIPVLFSENSSSPYNVQTVNSIHNTPPDAPTWESPLTGVADRGAGLTLDWAFSDADVGDAQTAYKLKRKVNAGAESWWNGSTWTTETKMTTATTSLSLSSGWGTDGDTHEYAVLTYDAADIAGAYSDWLEVIASVPANPTMTAPATSATVTVAYPTVSWTVSEQTAYQVDVYTSADVLLYSTGKVTSATTSITLGYAMANGLADTKFKITTWNTEGLICDTPDTNDLIDITYTVPATPTYTVTAVPASGYISVAIADPTPGGGQPTVLYHDVYVRVASGGTQSGERTVNDNGIRISTATVGEDGTYYDYACASGVAMEYRTLAVGDNGAVVYGAWT